MFIGSFLFNSCKKPWKKTISGYSNQPHTSKHNLRVPTFFVDFSCEITEKALKLTKKVEKRLKKMFRPAFACAQHPKAGRKHNTLPIFFCLSEQISMFLTNIMLQNLLALIICSLFFVYVYSFIGFPCIFCLCLGI